MSPRIPDLRELAGRRRALRAGWPPCAGIPERGQRDGSGALQGPPGRLGQLERLGKLGGGGLPPISTFGALRRVPGCAILTEDGGGGSEGAGPAGERRRRGRGRPRARRDTVLGDSPWQDRGGKGSTSLRVPGRGESVGTAAGAPPSQAPRSVGGDPPLGEAERPARPSPRGPLCRFTVGPGPWNSERRAARSVAAGASGFCAVGVRGQRFAYCYGDCGRQPQPAGSELSMTWAGGPALGSPRQRRPGGGRDAAARGRIPSVPPPRVARPRRARQPRPPRLPLRW